MLYNYTDKKCIKTCFLASVINFNCNKNNQMFINEMLPQNQKVFKCKLTWLKSISILRCWLHLGILYFVYKHVKKLTFWFPDWQQDFDFQSEDHGRDDDGGNGRGRDVGKVGSQESAGGNDDLKEPRIRHWTVLIEQLLRH